MCVLLIAACSPDADDLHKEKTVKIYNDRGGVVYDYLIDYKNYAMSGTTVEIVGECSSACTIFLGVGCVYPDATLNFHAAKNKITQKKSVIATNIMISLYPSGIRKWFYDNAFDLIGHEFATLSGRDAIKLGAKAC